MTEPTEDELAEFSHLVAELEHRLEQSFAAHDQIIARQVANDQENARLRAELASARGIGEPLAAIYHLAVLSAELTGKLNDALKPAVLDDKTREDFDELTRLLAGNLEQLTRHAQRANTVVGNMLPDSHDGASDHWAADIHALRQEFPSEGSSEQDLSSQDLSDQDPSDQDQALSGKQSG